MNQKIIEVHGLSKSYGSVQAVKGVDFQVEEGSLFAFLGVNGAGKSTTIGMLCTLLRPDGGEARMNGYRLGKEDAEIRRSIGMVFQEGLLDPLLTVRENLLVRGGLYSLSGHALRMAAEQAAEAADAVEFLNRPYGKLSGGQRRRADIARALIHTPKILFLDEPTTGLDPQTRRTVWNTVRELQKKQHMTVFLTTHYMEEAAQADFITILGKGSILAEGTPVDLKHQYAKDVLRLFPKDENRLASGLAERHIAFRKSGGAFCVELASTLESVELVRPLLPELVNLEVTNGTMDDVFLNVAGMEVREAC